MHLALALAPLPALAAACFEADGSTVVFPQLFGLTLGLDEPGAMLIGVAALLWVTAGAYAGNYLRDKPNAGAFAVWWLMTLTGNFGTFLAADLPGFYLFFTLASLSAYGLIAFDRTAEAKRAAAIYVGLAVLGEALLLMAFVLMAAGVPSGSLLIADAVASLATSPWRDYAMAFLILAFGLKIGLFPFHVWMPLTYSAAPIAAAAVLSGSAVKVGVIGLIRFLPFDLAMPDWGDVLVIAGLFSAFYGVVIGITQANPKTVLAYSSVSQMGLLAAALGMGLSAGEKQCRVGGSILRVVSRSGQRWSVPGYRCSCFDEAQRLVSPGTGGSAGAGPWRASVDRRRAGEIGDEACHGRRDRGPARHAFGNRQYASDAALFATDVEWLPAGGNRRSFGFGVALARDRACGGRLPWMLYSSVTDDLLRRRARPCRDLGSTLAGFIGRPRKPGALALEPPPPAHTGGGSAGS